MSFTFIDLFAGIGGFRAALESVGGEHLWTNEWDAKARETYVAWYGSAEVNGEDIRRVPMSDIPVADFLTAGFPCQPFSIAGVSKKNSLNQPHGFDDAKQGNLFDALANIIIKKRPKVFLLENVKNLESHDKGKTWKHIHYRLTKEAGYWVGKKVISSKTVVPQNRERVFIVGFDKEMFKVDPFENGTFRFPDLEGDAIPLSSILESNPSDRYMLSENLWTYLQGYREKHKALGNGFGFKLFGPSDTARTLSARYYKDGADILIDESGFDRPRRLTPREAIHLMGFTQEYSSIFGKPDGFPIVVSENQMYKQCGNAVVPGVVREVALAMLKAVESMGGFAPGDR